MNKRIIPAAALSGLLAFAGAITFALHRLGEVSWLSVDWSHLRQWLDTTPPTEALSAAARLVGLACGWWILLSTFFYLTARASRAASALRLATPLTFPFVRTLSAHLVVGAVAATTLGGSLPAMASTDRPVATGQLDAYPIPVPLLRSSPAAPQSDSLRLDPFLFPLPVLNLERRPTSPAADAIQACGDRDESEISLALSTTRRATPENEYRIVAGDNLWKIAQRILSQFLPHPPTNQQIAAYWVDLIEANRVTLRSGDPNLIYPGETIILSEIREV